ncbi:MAG: hypothetical protein ACP5FH_09505 [Terracidiphilus sp.]
METSTFASPFHLSGDTTENQSAQLLKLLGDAVQSALGVAFDRLDKHSIQTVLETGSQLKSEVAGLLVEMIQRHTVSDKFKDEEVGSDRSYPATYKVRPIEAQVTELRTCFPALGSCQEKLARKPLPEGAEEWFAIPRWEVLAPSYGEALERVLDVLAARRKFQNRIPGRLGPEYLRSSDRSRMAEKILADQQPRNDILVVAAQAGMRHRGCSARRARQRMAGNEFGLGAFAVGCLLLTHPERLSREDTLMIDCSGDEYSMHGDSTFDRVPLFDFDISGVALSIFYEDRSRNLWGTPSGFLCKLCPSGKLA